MDVTTGAIGACIGFVACLTAGEARAQESAPFTAPRAFAVPGTESYVGLAVGRGLQASDCPTTLIWCDSRDRSAQLYAGRRFGTNWGAEFGYVDTGRLLRSAGEARGQGLNLSLVGRAQVSSFGLFGKVGTTWGRSDTTIMGSAPAADQGFGLSWGGGVSYDFTPRLSALLEWASYDLRMTGGPVRSTNLGLQYRY